VWIFRTAFLLLEWGKVAKIPTFTAQFQNQITTMPFGTKTTNYLTTRYHLKQKFFQKSSAVKQEIKELLAENGNVLVDEVRLNQVFGGSRDIITMLWEPSLLDAQEGIRFRGYSLPELREKLPKGKGKEPLPEGLFWLMLVDEIPTEADVEWHCPSALTR
jgi:hypothetical protein